MITTAGIVWGNDCLTTEPARKCFVKNIWNGDAIHVADINSISYIFSCVLANPTTVTKRRFRQ